MVGVVVGVVLLLTNLIFAMSLFFVVVNNWTSGASKLERHIACAIEPWPSKTITRFVDASYAQTDQRLPLTVHTVILETAV